jgi:hypothetical protein
MGADSVVKKLSDAASHEPSFSQDLPATVWVLENGPELAECVAMPHWAGWELQLILDNDIIARKVVRSTADYSFVSTQWQWSMRRKGWG